VAETKGLVTGMKFVSKTLYFTASIVAVSAFVCFKFKLHVSNSLQPRSVGNVINAPIHVPLLLFCLLLSSFLVIRISSPIMKKKLEKLSLFDTTVKLHKKFIPIQLCTTSPDCHHCMVFMYFYDSTLLLHLLAVA